MKKLFSYLDKIGVNYRPVKYGYNYFYNVKPFTCQAALCMFEFSEINSVCKWHEQEKLIRRYANRYGYIVCNEGGCLGEYWFSVMKKTDCQILEDYSIFEKNSVSECEQLIHKQHIGDFVGDLEKALRSTMDYYGSLYNDFIAAVEGVTA